MDNNWAHANYTLGFLIIGNTEQLSGNIFIPKAGRKKYSGLSVSALGCRVRRSVIPTLTMRKNLTSKRKDRWCLQGQHRHKHSLT